jgi:hypothetical protein
LGGNVKGGVVGFRVHAHVNPVWGTFFEFCPKILLGICALSKLRVIDGTVEAQFSNRVASETSAWDRFKTKA